VERLLRLVVRGLPARAGFEKLCFSSCNPDLDPSALHFDGLKATRRRFELELRPPNLDARIRGQDPKPLLRTEVHDRDVNAPFRQAHGFIGRRADPLVASIPDGSHLAQHGRGPSGWTRRRHGARCLPVRA
jgi:hypothetical protein